MKKGYVVLEIGYEYNDEIYHTNEGETYEAPKKVYTNLDKARTAKKQAEYAAWRGEMIFNYGYDLEDNLNCSVEDLVEKWNELFGKKLVIEDVWNEEVPRDATDEQIDELLKIMTLRFLTLNEIEIED